MSLFALSLCLRLRSDSGERNFQYRKMLINIFLVAAYLYDDKITYVLTAGDKTLTVTDSLLDAIDESNAAYASSFMNDTAPP